MAILGQEGWREAVAQGNAMAVEDVVRAREP